MHQLPAQPPATRPHAVLRAICMDGQRVEVGAVVRLSPQLAQELALAGKVTPEPVAVDADAGAQPALADAPAAPAAASAPAPKARPRAPGRMQAV